MRGQGFVAAGLLLLCVGRAWPADPFPGIDPSWILLHEPAVREELKLSASQRQAFTKLMDGLDLRIFPLRNKSQDEMLPALAKVFDEGKQGLKTLLRPAQHQRLNEILMRRLGTRALMRDEVAAKMRYDTAQREEIETIIADTQSAVAALEQEVSQGKPRGPLEKRFVELKTDEQKRILKLLKPQQQSAWRELIGRDFDMSRLGRPVFKAPELVETGEWINSTPLRLEQQRGQVVVVHFYACGCINCIRNYPWYRQWHDAFHDKGVVLIGIHAPETSSERDLAHVRRKAAEEKFAFPVLLDVKSENWNAWGNSMWPSVYLIDKRGYLRHFWPGELNWQGNQGEKYLRERIEELLAEQGE
jgi:peroxiredoxin